MTTVYKQAWPLWVLFGAAALSFLTTLFLPYVGEEAVYTISSLEMWFNREWITPTVYGNNYARPPLFNWLIIPGAIELGWSNVLVVSRLVAALATLLTSFILMWFVKQIFHHRVLAIFSGVIYLSGDVLFRRGWLAYADPVFSLCVFGAMACVWVALEKQKPWLLVLAGCAVTAGFLSKALTAYVFYILTVLILLWRHPERRFLQTPFAGCVHGVVFVFPWIWSFGISQGAHGFGMVQDILLKLNLEMAKNHPFKAALYPLDTFLRWLPVSALLVYFWMRGWFREVSFTEKPFHNAFVLGCWIVGINYLPYCLAPQSSVRYLLPLYPLFACVIAYVVWQMRDRAMQLVLVFCVVAVVLRYVLGLWVFPYYERTHRGEYATVAQDIVRLTAEEDLFVDDDTAVCLSVVAHIDVLRLPKAPLQRPPQPWETGFLLTRSPNRPGAAVSKQFIFGTNTVYVLCKGKSCSN